MMQIMTPFRRKANLDLHPNSCCQIASKFLDLTRQKLELTRLPHEGSDPKSADWWEPKPLIEPLIDYWYMITYIPCPTSIICRC